MSSTLRVAKKYDVSYGDVCGFKLKLPEFKHLLRTLNVEVSGYEEDYDFEVQGEEFLQAIETLKFTDELQEDVQEAIEAFEIPKDDLIKTMERFFYESDMSNDFIHFSYF